MDVHSGKLHPCPRVNPSVREIKCCAFNHSSQLEEVELCKRIEVIGEGAFSHCISLKRIKGGIPSSVKKINRESFLCCGTPGASFWSCV